MKNKAKENKRKQKKRKQNKTKEKTKYKSINLYFRKMLRPI
jgi:hypothetical protein